MSVNLPHKIAGQVIPEKDGVYSITFTCARWLPLFKLSDSYDAVYKWFDYLKLNGHYIIGYIIMPNHVHAVIAFNNADKSINSIMGNGKRFIAYAIVDKLKAQQQHSILAQLQSMVNNTQKKANKKHEIFEPSFDWKECRTFSFIQQKLDYIHMNACKGEHPLTEAPEKYMHSSAKFYITGEQGLYHVTNFMELIDKSLTG